VSISNSYFSSNIVGATKSSSLRWAKRVANGGVKKSKLGFGGETWRKETTWRPRRMWWDNIKMLLKE